MARTSKKLRKKLKGNYFILIGFLLISLFIVLIASFSITNFLIGKVESNVEYTNNQPKSISISGIVHNLPIQEGQIRDGSWDLSDIQAMYLSNSGKLGDKGNVVLYGHNTNKVFGNLDKIQIGEKIEIISSDNNKYTYIIESVSEVKPNSIGILAQGADEEITLYTCSGFLDTIRLVVKGKRV